MSRTTLRYRVLDRDMQVVYEVDAGEVVEVVTGPDCCGEVVVSTGDGRILIVAPEDLA